MSIKSKAALQTLRFVGSIVLASALLVFLSTVFGPELVTWLMIITLFGFGTWMVYSINLSNLKYKEQEAEREQARQARQSN